MLLSALALATLVSAAESIHFDGVQGSPVWSSRLEIAVRDSLAARGLSLWPADSLQRLKDRNEWSGDQRDAARIASLAKRTKSGSIVWVKADPPVSAFERPWWSVLWTRRHWTVRADLFVADATGTAQVTRLALDKRVWLGFTGTNGADLWPVTEPERARAELALLAELSGAIAVKVAGDSSATTTP